MYYLVLPTALLLSLLIPILFQCLPCEMLCKYDANISTLTNELLLVTALSTPYMDRLRNLVGSIHIWAPNSKLLIYNLGLDLKSQLEIQTYMNVELLPLPHVPSHVQEQLWCYSFKALVIKDALNRYSSRPLLYVDAGIEIRRPLNDIETLIEIKGIFSVKQSNKIGKRTHPQSFFKLKADQFSKHYPFYSAGLVGFSPSNKKAMSLLDDWALCSRDKDCICPAGSNRWNHNFDQSIFSILLVNYKFHCEDETLTRYGPHDMAQPTFNPLAQNQIFFALRRWRLPKPYSSSIIYKKNDQFLTQPEKKNRMDRMPEYRPIQNIFLYFYDLFRNCFGCLTGSLILIYCIIVVYWLTHDSTWSPFPIWLPAYCCKLLHSLFFFLLFTYALAKYVEEG